MVSDNPWKSFQSALEYVSVETRHAPEQGNIAF